MNAQTIILIQNEMEALMTQIPENDSRRNIYNDTYTYVTCNDSDTLHFCFYDPTDSSDGFFIHLY